jgi:hypothetical protein
LNRAEGRRKKKGACDVRTKSKNLTLGLAAILLMLSAGSAFAATTIYDLLWYGQSLSVGAFGQPLLTPFAPYPSFVWMMYSSCDGLHSPNHGATVSRASTCYTQLEPAYDSYFSSLANTTPAQSSITPMAMALAKLENATNLSPYFLLENGMGVGGEPYSSLASGTTEYINLTNALTGAVGLLPSGWALNVPAIPYVQGEADSQAGTSRSSYASDLATLESNLTSSVETITGQSNAPILLLTQETNSFGPFGSASSAAAIIGAESDAAAAHPSTIALVTPNYVFENNAQQSGHLTARGYAYMGEYMARAYRKVVASGQGGLGGSWSAPIQSGTISNSANVVTIPFTGGTTPYVLDCSYVTSPNGACDGFSYTDNSGSPPNCSSVAVASNGTSILMTLSGTPSHAVTGTVEYAWPDGGTDEGATTTPGPTSGLRGCLHDSDAYTSLIDGKPLPVYGAAWNASFTTN